MGRRKDAERRKRREQRLAERLQQTKTNHHMYDVTQNREQEIEKSTACNDTGSSTQDDTTKNVEKSFNHSSEIFKGTNMGSALEKTFS